MRAWRSSVFLTFAVCGAGLAAIVARTPALRDDLEISLVEVSLLLLGLSLGSIVGLVGSARFVSRLGPRRTICGSLVLAACSLLATGIGSSVAHNFQFVAVALVCYGIGSGTCNVAMNVEGAAVERAIARPIMPIFHASFSAGGVIGSAIAAAAAALDFGVVVDLAVTASVVIAGAVIVAPHFGGPPRRPPEAHPRLARKHHVAWLDRRSILIGLLVLTTSFAAGSGSDWLSLAMVDGHDTSESFAAITLAAFVVAGTVARLTAVRLLSRFGRVAVLRGSALVCALGVTLVVVAPHPSLAVVGAILWGLGAALGFPVGMSAAADDPGLAAARISVVATIGYGASLIGPPVIGIVGKATGILSALLIVLVFTLGSAIFAASSSEKSRSLEEGSR